LGVVVAKAATTANRIAVTGRTILIAFISDNCFG
jgi:hypothetical protein